MTIDELLALANLTASDEIPVWDAEATGEPTKKITAQQLAAAVVALANLVTGVKGNAESSYRTGNVNLTPANIGAAAAQSFKGNIDNLMTSGIYYLDGATGTGGVQADNKLWGMLIVSAISGRVVQLHINVWTDAAEFRRYGDGTWHEWKRFTLS